MLIYVTIVHIIYIDHRTVGGPPGRAGGHPRQGVPEERVAELYCIV